MSVTLKIEGLGSLDRAFSSLSKQEYSGVKADGESAAYALVWELGKINAKPGPKTLISTNADGDEVLLTIQAPHGYIRINRQIYLGILNEEFKTIKWNELPMTKWAEEAGKVLDLAAARCLEVIQQYVPVDTGQLLFEMTVATHKDPLLEESKDINYYGYAGWNNV